MKYNFTKGPIRKNIILFSLPLIIGNLLQQFYNIVDTWVVGKFISSTALAAVGSAFALMVLLNSLILGLCMGSSVVFSQLYGNSKMSEMRKSVFNAFCLIFVSSLFLLIVSYSSLPIITRFMRIPQSTASYFNTYLLIIFGGIPFTFIFNFYSALLRSMGNSWLPLFFLLVSTLINIILDLVFVLSFGFGVEGVAYATVIAQGISAIGLATFSHLSDSNCKIYKGDMKLDFVLIKRIASVSILTSLQQSIMNFGILMIQSLVNSFGVQTMAAFTAGVKIDSFAYSPAQDFANGFSTFVAQNEGAGEKDRVKKGIKEAFLISTIFCFIISIFVFVFSKPLLGLFIDSKETEIIMIGVKYLRIEGSFYIGIGVLFLLYSIYRGFEKAQMSIILTIISLGLRILISYTLASSCGVNIIWISVPIGWFIADIFGLIRLRKDLKK